MATLPELSAIVAPVGFVSSRVKDSVPSITASSIICIVTLLNCSPEAKLRVPAVSVKSLPAKADPD